MASNPYNQIWSGLPSANLWGGSPRMPTGNNSPYGPTSGPGAATPYTGGPVTPGGTPPSGYDPRFGGVPSVPDPSASYNSALSWDQQHLGALEEMIKNINQSESAAMRANLEAGLPGYGGANQQAMRNTQDDLSGKLGSDELSQLALYGAQRGASGGFGADSPNANAAVMRALGLSARALKGQGQQELNAAVSRVPQPGFIDPTHFMPTGQEYQNANLQQSVWNSAPNPTAAAAAAMQAALAGRNAGNYGGGPGGGYQSPAGGFQNPYAINNPGGSPSWGAPAAPAAPTVGGYDAETSPYGPYGQAAGGGYDAQGNPISDEAWMQDGQVDYGPYGEQPQTDPYGDPSSYAGSYEDYYGY